MGSNRNDKMKININLIANVLAAITVGILGMFLSFGFFLFSGIMNCEPDHPYIFQSLPEYQNMSCSTAVYHHALAHWYVPVIIMLISYVCVCVSIIYSQNQKIKKRKRRK